MSSRPTTRAHAVAMCTALLLATAACGSGDDTTTADNGNQPSASPAPASTDDAPTEATVEELPPPDEADFVGSTRLVNLYVDDEGENRVIDIWAHRSFTNGPVLLAEEIGYGEVSDRFGAPTGMSVVIVEHGAGPDAEQIGSLFNPQEGEVTTHIYQWEETGATTGVHWEIAPEPHDDVPEPAEAGKALLILRAGQLSAHEEALDDTYGGRSFDVGAVGVDGCLPQQRVVDAGFSPSVLGGTQPTLHDVEPGIIELTFHRWPGDSECEEEPMLGPIEVDLPADAATLVLLHTPDLETIETLVLPWGS